MPHVFNTLSDENIANLTIWQLRGLEGIRMREVYRNASIKTGVEWCGKKYEKNNCDEATSIQKALVIANSLLYGICHACIVSLGYSPALGFIHKGNMLSFVYDIADLYKADISIPAAFDAVKLENEDLPRQVRLCCRERFESLHLLKRIANDISYVLE